MISPLDQCAHLSSVGLCPNRCPVCSCPDFFSSYCALPTSSKHFWAPQQLQFQGQLNFFDQKNKHGNISKGLSDIYKELLAFLGTILNSHHIQLYPYVWSWRRKCQSNAMFIHHLHHGWILDVWHLTFGSDIIDTNSGISIGWNCWNKRNLLQLL